jgi:hypothetical protein
MSDDTFGTTGVIEDMFGDPKEAGSGFAYKNHYLSDKEANIYRIAPPVKSLKNVGKWKIFDKLHFGYKIPNEKKPEKPRCPSFRCIFKQNRNKMVEQDCPECNFLAREAEADKAAQARGGTVRPWDDPTRHNLDKKYYVLAKNLAGEWGVLKLQYKAMVAIEDTLNDFAAKNNGEHGLSAKSGVWLTITKQGKAFETRFSAVVTLEDAGGGNYRRKPAALTALDVAGIEKCPDLATLNDNKVLSYDQIQSLVVSNGDPDIVAAVFGQGRRQESPMPPPTEQQGGYKAKEQPPEAPVTAPVTAPVAVVAEDDEEAALLRQMEALKAKKLAKAAETKVEVKPEPELKTEPKKTIGFDDLKKMGPAAFLAMFPATNSIK